MVTTWFESSLGLISCKLVKFRALNLRLFGLTRRELWTSCKVLVRGLKERKFWTDTIVLHQFWGPTWFDHHSRRVLHAKSVNLEHFQPLFWMLFNLARARKHLSHAQIKEIDFINKKGTRSSTRRLFHFTEDHLPAFFLLFFLFIFKGLDLILEDLFFLLVAQKQDMVL